MSSFGPFFRRPANRVTTGNPSCGSWASPMRHAGGVLVQSMFAHSDVRRCRQKLRSSRGPAQSQSAVGARGTSRLGRQKCSAGQPERLSWGGRWARAPHEVAAAHGVGGHGIARARGLALVHGIAGPIRPPQLMKSPTSKLGFQRVGPPQLPQGLSRRGACRRPAFAQPIDAHAAWRRWQRRHPAQVILFACRAGRIDESVHH